MYEEERNPFWRGLIGAIIGSIPGLVLWVIVGFFGVTWSLIGMLIVFGTFMGYEKLGGKPDSQSGIASCLLVMIVAVYLGVHLSWSMQLYSALVNYGYEDVTRFMCVEHLHQFLSILDLNGKFIGAVVKGYFFAAVGGFGLIAKAHGAN